MSSQLLVLLVITLKVSSDVSQLLRRRSSVGAVAATGVIGVTVFNSNAFKSSALVVLPILSTALPVLLVVTDRADAMDDEVEEVVSDVLEVCVINSFGFALPFTISMVWTPNTLASGVGADLIAAATHRLVNTLTPLAVAAAASSAPGVVFRCVRLWRKKLKLRSDW
jgi:hypothetical protein